MSRHPFTDEDIDAAFENLGMDKKGLRLAIYYLWESAVARGAVEENRKIGGTWDKLLHCWDETDLGPHSYTIKLPKEKP